MWAARMSADLKSKERYAKRTARVSEEVRLKVKKSRLTSMRAARMSVDFKSIERYERELQENLLYSNRKHRVTTETYF